ncbi:MAG: hypothetical protein A2231_09925 [Candidatus Firestonebacteria bacterium RIFOXYA2_FULL_40_8]|nr:MAG: hypothetical protein A2231_09925 [Candidatus Firestonebacteria bacterium RIFOXYA2_FULL_40_8]
MEYFKRYFTFVKPYRLLWICGIVFAIILTGIDLYIPLVLKRFISLFTETTHSKEEVVFVIRNMVITLLSVFVVRAILRGLAANFNHKVGYGIVCDIREKLYNHLQTLSAKYYGERQTGKIMYKLTSDVHIGEELFAHAFPETIINFIILFGVSIILFKINTELALFTLIPMPVIAFLIIRFSLKSRKAWRKVQEELADISAMLQDNIVGMNVIQSFTQEKYEEGRFKTESESHFKAAMTAVNTWGTYYPIIEFVAAIGTIMTIWFGGNLVLQGKLEIANLVAFLLYLGFFYNPIISLGRLTELYQRGFANAERIFKVIDAVPEIKDKPCAIETKKCSNKEIELVNVGFEYVKNKPVLYNLSFKAESGKITALVGPSGGGKTTIIHLIPRFYDPTSGVVKMNGVDLRDLKLQHIRRNIALVLQDVFLFNGSIKDNILYGKRDATVEQMKMAAMLANAHDYIMEFKDGYETLIGERGVKLSGGQKQRLSIARAILKDSPILLLEEATSSVDTETEHLIQQALERLTKNRTTIVIAHRLSTIQNADKILVLEKGRVVEEGNHDSLMSKKTLYSKLYKVQFKPQEKATTSL